MFHTYITAWHNYVPQWSTAYFFPRLSRCYCQVSSRRRCKVSSSYLLTNIARWLVLPLEERCVSVWACGYTGSSTVRLAAYRVSLLSHHSNKGPVIMEMLTRHDVIIKQINAGAGLCMFLPIVSFIYIYIYIYIYTGTCLFLYVLKRSW